MDRNSIQKRRRLDDAAVSSKEESSSNILEELVSFRQQIEQQNRRIEQKLDVSLRASFMLSLRSFDAYENMTQTSAGKNSAKQIEIKTRYYNYCGISTAPDETNMMQRDFCVLTGRSGKLKLAHLVPASASEDIRKTLQLSNDHNGIWSIRNVLLLCWNIEQAFDRKKLSFVQNPLRSDLYTMTIWDDDIRSELIWDGAKVESEASDNTIGFYDGRPLILQMKNGVKLEPFKRCLSYQHFLCILYSRLRTGDPPTDFASEIGDKWICKRSDLLVLRASLDKQVMTEVEEEENEQDESKLGDV